MSALDLATSYRSPQLLSARARGFDARLRGSSRYACPYQGEHGWSAVYAAAWREGWTAADSITAPPRTAAA